MDEFKIRRWFYWGLANLAIVALYGVAMRFKIAYDFPFLQQKNLLHAHSHFAFNGWVSQMLYAGLMLVSFPFLDRVKQKKYHLLLALNVFCSFGMLIAFTVQGYKAISISFSTISIIVAVIYAVFFIRDQKHLPAEHPSKKWATTGLLLNILSALGPFSLAYMMINKHVDPNIYLGSIYYYLHFQYSGWFFFGSMALIAAYLPKNFPSLQKYFWWFAATALPTFFLSILWAKLPMWIYVVTVIATFVQLLAWIGLLGALLKYYKQHRVEISKSWVSWLFYIPLFALTMKFVLQAVSVIPSLSQLVFGFRPIVIAYLHLVLLGVYSLFLIAFLFWQGVIIPTKMAKRVTVVFIVGVILNELFLGIQGAAALAYIPIAYINQMLLGAALVLLLGAISLAWVSIKGRRVRH